MSSQHLITPKALQTLLASDPASVLVCDCRYDLVDADLGRRAYEASHIPGAVFVDLGRMLSGEKNGSNGRHPLPEQRVFAEQLAGLGVNADTLVVAYDAPGGSYAARLWWLARWVGHAKVVVLDGTIDAWTKAGFELTPTKPAARLRGNFKQASALTKAVDLANMRAGLGRRDRLIIDGRPGDRFQGLNETLDAKAGHIPGSLSRPSKDNLDADWKLKSPEVLRAEFARLIGDRTPSEVVASCGSGVSACHLLLAMELAGLSGAALYGGSWSEWSSQPDAQIELGAAKG
jgi:thiosulfate/3-mercaptopyruvate sulfurtransferase